MPADSPQLVYSNMPSPAHDGDVFSDAIGLRLAIGMLRFQRSLGQHVGNHLIADPTLIMLLELYVARLRGKPMTIKALVLTSGVPQSTALRWIDRLEAEQLLTKKVNAVDRRTADVALTDRAIAAVRSVLTDFLGHMLG